MSEHVRDFFERYRNSYIRRDADALAEMFAYPLHITSDARTVTLVSCDSEESWRNQLLNLLDMYNAIGMADARLLKLDARQLSPRTWLAELHWELSDAQGHALYDFHNVYVLAEIGGALRIASAVSPDERPRYAECQARLAGGGR